MDGLKPILVAVILSLCLVTASTSPLGNLLETHGRHVRAVADDLIRRTFDFGTSCPGNIILTLNGKQLNQGNLRLTATDAAALAPALYDQSFEDRIDVWCKVAKMTQELAESIGEQINIFNIEDIKLFQGDVLLTKRSVDAVIDNDPTGQGRLLRTLRATASNPDPQFLRTQRTRVKRKVISNPIYKWENTVVPWKFDDSKFTEADRMAIRAGIKSWEGKTCLRFPERNNPGSIPHIRFIKDRGCYSYIGKEPRGQPVSIGEGCQRLGIVVHEIGHAIGLSHEQSRPDRNRYVRIDTSNVWNGFLGNFLANSWSNYHTDSVPYDYSSVMHYAARDFARDTAKDTVISLDPEMRETMGQRNDLSFYDVKVANKWYCSNACPGLLTLEWKKCKNDGYRNPNQCGECVCPPGFAPPFCEDVAQSSRCGRSDLVASTTRKTLKSPGFDGAGHPLQTECFYKFTAPEGMSVKLKFKSMRIQGATGRSPACRAFVEVRYKHPSLTGPRFCGEKPPTKTFTSHGRTAMVTFLTRTEQKKGFEIEYSAEPCGGCSASSASREAACLRTVKRDCMTEGQENECFELTDENKRYCCDGYSLSGKMCKASSITTTTTTSTTTTTTTTTRPPTAWGRWSRWSKCSRPCGNCGYQFRTRMCLISSLCGNGAPFQLRRCNTQPCGAGVPEGFCDPPRLAHLRH